MINSDDRTRFEDKVDNDPNYDASSVMEGHYVEARGQEIPAGEITAFEFRRDNVDPDTELRGFTDPTSVVTDSQAAGYRESVVILGVTVDTRSVEVYRDENDAAISADAFWSAVEADATAGRGTLVDFKGTETGDAALLAQEAELEME